MRNDAVWETPFDEAMLQGEPENREIIIWCPQGSLTAGLMEILSVHGLKWNDGTALTDSIEWTRYKEDTCYWIRGKRVTWESRGFAEDDKFSNYIKCTFYGQNSDFEPANEAEMRAFLGF